MVAKAIDMDISFFERTLYDVATSEQNNSCSSDNECEFVGCLIKCDMKTRTCAGVVSSNNFRVSIYGSNRSLLYTPMQYLYTIKKHFEPGYCYKFLFIAGNMFASIQAVLLPPPCFAAEPSQDNS